MLLLLLTWAALGASANTLILTTADTYGVSNLLKEFDNPGSPGGAPGRVMQGALSSANGISAATFADAPGPYDLVVVYSVYSTVDATNWAVLQDAANRRLANAFVFFVDGCAQCRANVNSFIPFLNTATGLNMSVGINQQSGPLNFALNTTSPYQANFQGLNPLTGGYVSYIDSVPYANTLYLPAGVAPTTPAPTSSTPTTAFGVLFPQTMVNSGQGACIFGVLDATIFDSSFGYASGKNPGKIAPAFQAAAAAGSTSCQVIVAPDVTSVSSPVPVAVPTTGTWSLLALSLSLLMAGLRRQALRSKFR